METYQDLVAEIGEEAANAIIEVSRLIILLKQQYDITISPDEDEEDLTALSAYDFTGRQIWTIS